MPALPDVPNTLRIAFEYDLGGTLRGGNRVFYSYSGGPPSAANLDTLATDVSATFGTYLAGHMSDDFSLIAVRIIDLSSDSSAEGNWAGTVAGANSGNPPTVDTAFLMNCTIDRRYRGGKPRIYWPFGVVGNLNADTVTWQSSFVTDVDSDWVSFDTALKALTGIGCELTAHVNVSYYSGFASVQNPVTKRWRNIPTPRPGPISPDVITSTLGRPEISQQRRRRTSTSA